MEEGEWRRTSRDGLITHSYSYDPDRLETIEVSGTVGRRVKSVTLQLRGGPHIPVPIIKVPRELRFPWNYYVGYIPKVDGGRRIARDRHGDVVEKERLFRHGLRTD